MTNRSSCRTMLVVGGGGRGYLKEGLAGRAVVQRPQAAASPAAVEPAPDVVLSVR
jgi:hypothetical protein